MKIGLLAVVFAILGVAAGLSATALEVARYGKGQVQLGDGATVSSDEKRPVVAVDNEDFNFGSMQKGSKMSHVFTVRNEGTAPLTLGKLQTTCKCTLGELAQSAIPPGGSTTVTLEWEADTGQGEFRQQASLQTNDPSRPLLTLTVHGEVTFTHQVKPDRIIFDGLSAHTGGSSSARIVSWVDQPLEITSHEFAKHEYSDYFTAEFQAIPAGELTDDAKSGFVITVSAKPGLPLQPIHQVLRLTTNLSDGPVVEVPIQGSVRGDITIVGTNYNSPASTLTLGTIRSAAGGGADLTIFVRGPHRESIVLEQVSSSPAGVRAIIGEPVSRNTVTTIPVRIEVPAGTPQGNYLGLQQGEMGEIILSTGHPDTKELKIRLRMLIEG